ncbi:hypothetical protein [Mucilaginibacter sp.]|uniref:hypothetical protein n=1 Tax=Mucilaginibacter sp. TaxID=1882438 RepID=UPI003D1516AD
MQELKDQINAISAHTDDYLVKAQTENGTYYQEFLTAAAVTKGLLSKKEYQVWATQKMGLRDLPFDEKNFIQCAVETAVARFFGERFPTGFRTEAKIRPGSKKDVDCRFEDAGYIFNVEVKCAAFGNKDEIEGVDAFKYGTIGRLPDRGEEAIAAITAAINEGLALQGEDPKPQVPVKNMDYNLMTYLQGAHDKFNPDAGEKELNILLVGCDNADDMQKWFYYLYGPEGLFMDDSFADRSTYKLVDAVVFTNQYDKHHRFFDKTVSSSWTLENNAIFIFQNPFALKIKQAALVHFESLLPHYMEEFTEYEVPGDTPADIKLWFWISYFIKDYLERDRGIFLFSAPRA